MVSSNIVSQYSGELPKADGDRKIRGLKGPLYDPAAVLSLIDKGKLVPWSKGCLKDMQKWEFDQEDIEELTSYAIKTGRYRDSEWCEPKANGPWAACDAYYFTRREWNENAYKEMNIEYFVKVAIGKTGKILLLASCHPSGS
jgi:hypothetical protein